MTKISATGINRCCAVHGTGRWSGFTLIELLLVVALIGLAGSVFVLNFNRLLSDNERESAEDTLRRAVSSARFEAAARRTKTALFWDVENGQLVIIDALNGTPLQQLQLDSDFSTGGSGRIQFYQSNTQAGIAAPFGSQQEQALNQVRFAPDRSATPFRAVISRSGSASVEKVFEPFSGMVVSEEGSRL